MTEEKQPSKFKKIGIIGLLFVLGFLFGYFILATLF